VEAFVLPFARLLPVPPRLKIVDVGAAASPSGTAYASLLSSFPCDVVGFEPLEAECAKLNALALPGHRYLPYAIADGTRRTFYECQSSECSSLFEPDHGARGKGSRAWTNRSASSVPASSTPNASTICRKRWAPIS
jgi:hypothetical protein